jgi:opacity protein-like surface antigen
MKKTFLAVFFSLFILSTAHADLGVNLGVSAQIGSMETKGKETSSDGTSQTSQVEEHIFATAGFFIEKDLTFLPGPLKRLSIGFDNIAHDLDLGTQSNFRNQSLGAKGTPTVVSGHNSLSAEITGFETLYATLRITDWLYLKGGNVTVDVKTEHHQNGVKQTSYGDNHSLDGTVVGFGVEHTADNGMFFRVEYNDYSIDGKSVKSTKADSKFTAQLQDVSGSTGRISVGKTF